MGFEAGEREVRSLFPSTVGGVMTVEVGAVTGELELATRVEGGELLARVRYAGAGEWYAVEGSPARLGAKSDRNPDVLHCRVRDHLRRPGPVEAGNEAAVSLSGFDPDSG